MPAAEDLSPPKPNLRRKLIRGAFAAPSLLTVCPGSAFAASSHLRALVNANANPVDATAIIEGQDTFARVQLYEVESAAETAPTQASDEPVSTADEEKKAKKPPKKTKDEAVADGSSEATAEPEPLVPETVKRYYVRGRDLGAYKKSGADVPTVGEWLEFDPGTQEKVAGVVPEGAVSGQSSTMYTARAVTAQPSNKWVTVRFDERGHIVGLGGSGDGAIVPNSALASATAFIV